MIGLLSFVLAVLGVIRRAILPPRIASGRNVIGISGRRRVAHGNEGTGGNRPDRKFLENVLLHVCSSKMPVAECEGLIVIEMMPDLNRYQVRSSTF